MDFPQQPYAVNSRHQPQTVRNEPQFQYAWPHHPNTIQPFNPPTPCSPRQRLLAPSLELRRPSGPRHTQAKKPQHSPGQLVPLACPNPMSWTYGQRSANFKQFCEPTLIHMTRGPCELSICLKVKSAFLENSSRIPPLGSSC